MSIFMFRSRFRGDLLGVLALLVTLAAPSEAGTTLTDVVVQKKVVWLADGSNVLPYSGTTTDNSLPTGYVNDVCRAIAEQIAQGFGELGVTTEFVWKREDSRATILCSAGQKDASSVALGNPIYVEDLIIVYLAKRPLESLRGRSVAVPSKHAEWLRQAQDRQELDFTPLHVESFAKAVEYLMDGRADAMVVPDMAWHAAVAATPSIREILQRSNVRVGSQTVFTAVPHGDAEWKAVVDATTAQMLRSGAISKIYEQWFSGITGFGSTRYPAFRVPMGHGMRMLLESPPYGRDASAESIHAVLKNAVDGARASPSLATSPSRPRPSVQDVTSAQVASCSPNSSGSAGREFELKGLAVGMSTCEFAKTYPVLAKKCAGQASCKTWSSISEQGKLAISAVGYASEFQPHKELTTLADCHVLEWTLRFSEDVLREYVVVLPEHCFASVAEALPSKFGKPKYNRNEAVTTKGGASLTNTTVGWASRGSTATLSRYFNTVNNSVLVVSQKTFGESRSKADAAKRAADL